MTGIFNMTRAEYESIPALNQSTLKMWKTHGLGGCPAKFLHKTLAKEEEEQSEALILGNALDCILTEGEEYYSLRYPAWSGRKAGKEYEAFKEKHEGKVVLSADQRADVIGMANSVKAHEIWGVINRCKKTVAVAELCGTLCKGEIDAYNEKCNYVFDLKTAKDASNEEVGKQAFNLGYHIQSAFYLDLLDALGYRGNGFQWVVVEKSAPYLVNVITAEYDSPEIEIGRREYRALMQSYAAAVADGKWPSYECYQPLAFPKWAYAYNQ